MYNEVTGPTEPYGPNFLIGFEALLLSLEFLILNKFFDSEIILDMIVAYEGIEWDGILWISLLSGDGGN